MPIDNTHLQIKTKFLSSPRDRFILSCLNIGVARQESKDFIMKKIPLTQGKFAIVDDGDYDELNQHNWHATKGQNKNKFYAARWNKGKRPYNVTMHRLIMDCPDNMQVDHINGDSLDNRKCNLRICTQQQNSMNRKYKNPKCSTDVVGVSRKKGRRGYKACIYVNNKNIWLGTFDDIKDAQKAYIEANKKHFGEYSPFSDQTLTDKGVE